MDLVKYTYIGGPEDGKTLSNVLFGDWVVVPVLHPDYVWKIIEHKYKIDYHKKTLNYVGVRG